MERSCAIFDFDCTLTVRHLYHLVYTLNYFEGRLFNVNYIPENVNPMNYRPPKLNSFFDMQISNYFKNSNSVNFINDSVLNEEIMEYFLTIIWGGRNRIELIKNMFQTLKDNNIDIIISTNGKEKDVVRALQLAGLSGYVKLIHEGISGNTFPNVGKYNGKYNFILGYIMTNYNKILYIDDDGSDSEKVIAKLMDKYDCEIESGKYHSCDNEIDYYFIDNLRKDMGGGITPEQIDIIYDFFQI